MVVDGGRESSSTDPIAHDMDPFTEPELYPKNRHFHTHKQVSTYEEISDVRGKLGWLYFVITSNLGAVQQQTFQ